MDGSEETDPLFSPKVKFSQPGAPDSLRGVLFSREGVWGA